MLYHQGLLAFYGLPSPQSLPEISTVVPSYPPEGVQYELQTLPVRPLIFSPAINQA